MVVLPFESVGEVGDVASRKVEGEKHSVVVRLAEEEGNSSIRSMSGSDTRK